MKFSIVRDKGYVFLYVDGRIVVTVSEAMWSKALANAKVLSTGQLEVDPLLPKPPGENVAFLLGAQP